MNKLNAMRFVFSFFMFLLFFFRFVSVDGTLFFRFHSMYTVPEFTKVCENIQDLIIIK